MSAFFRNVILTAYLLFLLGVSFGQLPTRTETYKNGRTEYVAGKTYKTTGQPLVKRSSMPKTAFLKSLGLSSTPVGYQIDHIQPLSQGGEDIPENMQLLTIEQHKMKTAIERGEVAETNNVLFTSFDVFDQKPVGIRTRVDWEIQKYTSVDFINSEINSSKVLYAGPRGGSYYYNSAGRKMYVKAKATSSGLSVPSANYSIPNTLSQPSDFNSQLYNNTSAPTPAQSTSGTTREILTGPRGGQYYINSNGNKTYIKKN